ncbi:MAG: efflux RND transporter periplasmic adaptor subunit [Prevotellaceae bacterium]|nr:efflux RND transporter periplasmic adaptor subunit [Prevotellaceae bacterium]
MKKKNQDIRTGLFALIIVIVIIFIIGLIVNKPEPLIIEGEAVASEVRVSGKVPGRIHEFRTSEGGCVHAGDTLVIIESPELAAKLEQANAAVDAAQAQNKKAMKGARKEMILGAYEMYQKALAGVDIAQKSYGRVQRLYDKGVVSAQKRDEAEAQYKAAVATANAAKSQYDMAMNGAEAEDKDAARALVDRANGAVNEVESYLQEVTLVSPIDGEVSEIYPKRGELVGTGAPIMSIVDLNDIWFTFNVREDLLGDLKMDKVFKVKVPALNNQIITVKVNYIKALASYATWKATKTTGQFDLKTFEVRARPTTHIADLRPGMTAIFEELVK